MDVIFVKIEVPVYLHTSMGVYRLYISFYIRKLINDLTSYFNSAFTYCAMY